MTHCEPWFSCNQCGRFLHLGAEALKEQEHFCNPHCKEIYERVKKMKEVQLTFANLFP